MKATEIVKKYGILEGECRMISEKKGIIWRENREGNYEPILVFIPASNEPSGHACMSIWRLPRGSNTPQLCCAVSLMPRSLLRGL